jgi:hypothetical protein
MEFHLKEGLQMESRGMKCFVLDLATTIVILQQEQLMVQYACTILLQANCLPKWVEKLYL